MDWTPTLTDRQGPVYRRIVDALAADIAGGCLRRGQQLPTHRALAKALGVDLTTVTRAYTEARRLGLTEARVGQGTFVAESLSQVRHGGLRPEFDLSMNCRRSRWSWISMAGSRGALQPSSERLASLRTSTIGSLGEVKPIATLRQLGCTAHPACGP